jgi:hypothetical protein
MPDFTRKFDTAIPVYNPQTEFASKRFYFNQFLNACEKANTQVVLVFPPNFYAPSSIAAGSGGSGNARPARPFEGQGSTTAQVDQR